MILTEREHGMFEKLRSMLIADDERIGCERGEVNHIRTIGIIDDILVADEIWYILFKFELWRKWISCQI